MSERYVIKGKRPVTGVVKLSGAKNVALKLIIASMLVSEQISLENVPRILDVDSIIELIYHLGASARFSSKNTLEINPNKLNRYEVDLLYGCKTRVSFMFFAPLLYKFKKAVIPNPGGCRLGERPIDRHVSMLRAFGITVDYDSSTGYYTASLPGDKFHGANYKFEKKTHTGTELALMIASVADSPSVIRNAAAEPEIDDLIDFLNKTNVVITRHGEDIDVVPAKKMSFSGSSYKVTSDRNEAVTYACLALATGGEIEIGQIKASDIAYFIDTAEMSGAKITTATNSIHIHKSFGLSSTDVITSPHPGFMTDWQGPWSVVMTQASGESTIHETVFEQRFGYVSELRRLGADISFFDPKPVSPQRLYQFRYVPGSEKNQAIKIKGPTKLHNAVLKVSDLRAGATLVIASCAADGESVVEGASVIERGYEDLEEKLKSLGVDIKKI